MAQNFTYTPSTNYSKSSRPRVFKLQFGGGYSQRVPDAVNNIELTWTLQFQNRPFSEANAILAFLEDKLGTEPFVFTPPDELTTSHKVICEEWSDVVTSPNSKTISCKFTKVYE